jgi:hypothetical protein
MSRMRTAGLLLLLGALLTFGLHFAGAPEGLYRWLYHHLLSGLDVPRDPSEGSVAAVRDVSLYGGTGELVVGLALLAWAGLQGTLARRAEHGAHRPRLDA